MGAATGVGEPYPQRWLALGGVYTLVLSGLQLSASAIGLSYYTCARDDPSTVVWKMVRLYYFSNVNCKSSYSINGSMYHLAGVNIAAYRTLYIISLSTALSSIWVIGSFLILVSAMKGKHMKPNTGRTLHFPWSVSMVFVIIMDAIAAIMFCIDLSSTSSFSSLMGLLNIKADGGTYVLHKRYLPPTIMALLSSKGVLLWILNIIIVTCMQKQFRKLYKLRQHSEFIQAQLATMPVYMVPPKLLKNKTPNKDDPAPMEPAPVLPRLTNKDGAWVGEAQQPSSSQGRSSALQMAARQGFSYERPPSSTYGYERPLYGSIGLEGSMQPLPRLTTPQKYGYGGFPQETSDNWQTRPSSHSYMENNRSSNILQRDNEVFY